jgi:hypothetical protein
LVPFFGVVYVSRNPHAAASRVSVLDRSTQIAQDPGKVAVELEDFFLRANSGQVCMYGNICRQITLGSTNLRPSAVAVPFEISARAEPSERGIRGQSMHEH